MNWILPPSLLLVAGVVALVFFADLLRRRVSGPRLIVETVLTTLVIVAPFQVTWAAILWLEDRR